MISLSFCLLPVRPQPSVRRFRRMKSFDGRNHLITSCLTNMGWRLSGRFSRLSLVMRTSSFGWPVKTTKKSRAPPSLCRRQTRSSRSSLTSKRPERLTLTIAPGRRPSRAWQIRHQPASMRLKLKSTASWRKTPTHDSSGQRCTKTSSTGLKCKPSGGLFDRRGRSQTEHRLELTL